MNLTKNSLKKAIDLVGSQRKLGLLLGVRPQQVSKWLKAGKVPGGHVISIEKITGGKVSRSHLRPDLYPIEDYLL